MKFETQSVAAILLAARELTEKVTFCWLMTADQNGSANARVMQPIFSQVDQTGWVVRFLARGSSRKAAEMTKSGRVTLGYQYDSEKAYVTLAGNVRIIDDRNYLHAQWRPEWNVHFPSGPSDMASVIVEVTVERIELWNLERRIAAPPDGSRPATLQRTSSGDWQSLYG